MPRYILVDLTDDSGNDDGIIAEQTMTIEEAAEANTELSEEGSDMRWIKKY